MFAKFIVHMYITAKVKTTGLHVLLVYAVMSNLYLGYGSSVVRHTCSMWQAYMLKVICQKCEVYAYK